MRFLDGLKTIVGLLGLALVALNQQGVIDVVPTGWRPYIVGGATVLTTLGVVHKAEKRADRRRVRRTRGMLR